MPNDLASWAEAEMNRRMHANFSSFVCDLLREERKRQIGEDLAFLQQHAPKSADEPGEDYWREFYADVRAHRKTP